MRNKMRNKKKMRNKTRNKLLLVVPGTIKRKTHKQTTNDTAHDDNNNKLVD